MKPQEKYIFRGRTESGVWLNGFYAYLPISDSHNIGVIVNESKKTQLQWHEVQEETVGRLIVDDKTIKAYSGDIVEALVESYDWDNDKIDYEKEYFLVCDDNFRFWLQGEKFGIEGEGLIYPNQCVVVGNRWDNPELFAKVKKTPVTP